MPDGMFVARWTPELHQKHGVSLKDGLLLLEVDEKYRKPMIGKLKSLADWQNKKAARIEESGGDPSEAIREMEFRYRYHYQKRSLNQNRMLWSLYGIEAYIINGGMSGHRDQNVTPEKLYEDDLDEFGEKEIVRTKRKNLSWYIDEFHVRMIRSGAAVYMPAEAYHEIKDFEREIEITYIRGTSKLDTREMAVWIERIFNRISYLGVPMEKSDEIRDFWLKQREHINKKKITVHDKLMDQDEYRDLVMICEATGEFIGNGSGVLVPIFPEKVSGTMNHAWNWLHLSEHAFVVWENERAQFLRRYPHLKHKITQAAENALGESKEK